MSPIAEIIIYIFNCAALVILTSGRIHLVKVLYKEVRLTIDRRDRRTVVATPLSFPFFLAWAMMVGGIILWNAEPLVWNLTFDRKAAGIALCTGPPVANVVAAFCLEVLRMLRFFPGYLDDPMMRRQIVLFAYGSALQLFVVVLGVLPAGSLEQAMKLGKHFNNIFLVCLIPLMFLSREDRG